MKRAAQASADVDEADRVLAAAGYGVSLLKKEAALVLRTSTRSVDRLIAIGRLKSWRSAESGSSRVLIPRRAVAELLAGES